MSNEKRAPGCLGFFGDEILPNYMGILIFANRRIPKKTNQDSMESRRVFFRSSNGIGIGSTKSTKLIFFFSVVLSLVFFKK